MALYPQCATFFSGENLDQHAVVKANYFGGKLMEIATALNISFGPAAWMALAIHAFAAELYVSHRFGHMSSGVAKTYILTS